MTPPDLVTRDPGRSDFRARCRRLGRVPVAPVAVALLVVVGIALSPCHAPAHDPSAWGGLFRSRDGGATWLAVDTGSFVSGAIGLAINPARSDQLLLATDSGVLTSRNAGRDWTVEAPNVLVGTAFAVTYDADGTHALAFPAPRCSSGATATGGDRSQAPAGATPTRTLARGSAPGRVYLAGWRGFYRSEDWGVSWVGCERGTARGPGRGRGRRSAGPREIVYVIAGGRLWASADGARHWRPRRRRLRSRSRAVTADDVRSRPRLGVVSGQLFRSDDRGERWRPVGRPLPAPRPVRGLAVMDPVVVLATDRGLYRSPDTGERWDALTENLPAHLEAGPLVRDPRSLDDLRRLLAHAVCRALASRRRGRERSSRDSTPRSSPAESRSSLSCFSARWR